MQSLLDKGKEKARAPESSECPALASAELQAKARTLSAAMPARCAASSNRRTAVGLTSVAVTLDCGFSYTKGGITMISLQQFISKTQQGARVGLYKVLIETVSHHMMQ